MAGSNERVYGSWTSPISSKKATEGSVQFPEIHVDKASKSGRLDIATGPGKLYQRWIDFTDVEATLKQHYFPLIISIDTLANQWVLCILL